MSEEVRPRSSRRLSLHTVIVLSFVLLSIVPAALIGFATRLAPFRENAGLVALLCLAALGLSAACGRAIARRVTEPIRSLAASAKSVADGTWNQPVPVDREDELGELTRAFNEMAVRFRKSIDVLNGEVMERMQAEQGLRESEEKYRALFEESHDMNFVSTPGGTLIDVNAAGVAMLGYPSKEALLGISIADEMYAYPEDRALLLACLESQGEANDFQTRFRCLDGREIDVSISAAAIRNTWGQFVALRGSVRDITEHRHLEQQLRQAQKMEAVGQLAGGIAHDFNNILTAVIGYANLLESNLAPDDPLRPYSRSIAESAEKGAELTRGLLAFSRKQVLNKRPVSLNGLLAGMAALLRRLIREDIELLPAFCEDDTSILADPVQVEQVVMNLVTNAADAMPGGGTITLETSVREGHAILSVTDTGKGMDEATQDKIFDPFFTTKEVGKGTGLGLAMVYGIVRQHKGTIFVHSEPGKGTCIKVSFPSGDPAAADPEPAVPDSPPMRGSETILVAEDDGALRDLVKEMLGRFGYEVLLASDGVEALEIYSADPARVDMMLVDLVMPRMNGRALHDAARAMNPDVKVLFYSGYTADLVQSEGTLEPGMQLLPKPFSVHALASRVRQILDAPAG